MLLLLPVTLLLVSGLAISIWQAIKPSFGYAWLVAVAVSFITWVITLYFRWRLPTQLVIPTWLSVTGQQDFPLFRLDYASWPYAFGLVSVLLAVVLTASARLQYNTNPFAWSGSLLVTGMGVIGTLAANPLTVVLTWSAIDLVELVVVQGVIHGERSSIQSVVAFGTRLAGTLVLLWVMMISSPSQSGSFQNISSTAVVFVLLAASLRLGVIPLHMPYSQEIPLRRGLGNILRLAAPTSSLAVLARLPLNPIPEQWKGLLMAFTCLACLYGATMWLTARDELNGRPYWLISLAGLAVACAILGNPGASTAWGSALILTGSLLFLYSARQKSLWVFPIMGGFFLSGLPFSIIASGWAGLFLSNNLVWEAILLFVVILLFTGYIRHAWGKGDVLSEMERWVQTAYPLGLSVILAACLIIATFGWPGVMNIHFWWAGLATFVISAGFIFVLYRFQNHPNNDAINSFWAVTLLRRIGKGLSAFFLTDWFYSLIWFFYGLIQKIVQLIVSILEGDGGVLWALLLLALIITLLHTGRKP
jgi:hypothetical protein